MAQDSKIAWTRHTATKIAKVDQPYAPVPDSWQDYGYCQVCDE